MHSRGMDTIDSASDARLSKALAWAHIYVGSRNSIELIAVALAVSYEWSQDRVVSYVGRGGWPSMPLRNQMTEWVRQRAPVPPPRVSYDLISQTSSGDIARLIEVKGKGRPGTSESSVSILDRQRDTAIAFGLDYWLYVGMDCSRPDPYLVVVQDPQRLPWRLISPLRVAEPGKHLALEEENQWHVMPSEIRDLGQRVEI